MEDLQAIISICKPPTSAISFIPPHEALFHTKGKHPQRNIFKHQVFNEREVEKIKRLQLEIKNQKISVPSDWDDSELLKFVYAAGFKTRLAVKHIKSCLASRAEVHSDDYLLLYPKIIEILVRLTQKTGPIYFHGRDRCYRPLLIMNFARFDVKLFSTEQYLLSACFLLEFAVQHMLNPGTVENWMCISDLGFKGIGHLPLSTLRKITKILQDIFKCRLACSAMINSPKSIHLIFSCLKPFLDPATLDKINIVKGNIATNVISHFDLDQIEQKYGGKAQNLTEFWPPVFPKSKAQVLEVRAEDCEAVSDIVIADKTCAEMKETALQDTPPKVKKIKKKKKRSQDRKAEKILQFEGTKEVDLNKNHLEFTRELSFIPAKFDFSAFEPFDWFEEPLHIPPAIKAESAEPKTTHTTCGMTSCILS